MRRLWIFLLLSIAMAALAGSVSAEPKVTISGFVDNLTTWTHNASIGDFNVARNHDTEWYSRTRVRPDIVAEVGTTKFVLGLEIDATWGQTGNIGTAGNCGGTPAAALGICSAPQRFGATAGWALNTDTQGIIEIKWAFTEFDVPVVPVPTRMRLGAQPFETTYKLAVLANGDFAGAHLTSQLGPKVKFNFTYAQIEEQSTGPRDGFVRGEDFAIITSIEVTPVKDLDIRPIFSYAQFLGPTNFAARVPRGGINFGTAFPLVGGPSPTVVENRFTIGVDTLWRSGSFSLDPTVLYQFGDRDQFLAGISRRNLDRSAWLVDIRGGWREGPLGLELAAIYTTGNKARDRIDVNANRIKFFEPISTDSSYYGGWAELSAIGIDYFSAALASSQARVTGATIGYDKYGLIRLGARGGYALTPDFTVRAALTASWTAEPVDTSSTSTPVANLRPVDGEGDARYLGTELNLGFQWRFAPNVALDVVGAYLFTGGAMTTSCVFDACGTPGAVNGRHPQDVQSAVARVRYSW